MVSPTGHIGGSSPAVAIHGVQRAFGDKQALRDVSFEVAPGEIHALLGPNGAGKTTLLRILTGLVEPDGGEVRVLGQDWPMLSHRSTRQLLGVVPPGTRSFYLRLSGLENLIFFARLYGLSRRQARQRSEKMLEAVGLAPAARTRVGVYSQGMTRRLAIARALLMSPPLLLIDEATHDLDPRGAEDVRQMVAAEAARGAAVVWATQRVEEIRGFADTVTILNQGTVRFNGRVGKLLALAPGKRFLIELSHRADPAAWLEQAQTALDDAGTLRPDGTHDDGHFVLEVGESSDLGTAISRLTAREFRVLACHDERSEAEAAFLALVGEEE